jgi:hypothetical protein
VSDSVRQFISNPDEGKTVNTQISMVVYSPFSYDKVRDQEFLVVASYAGGSYDDVSVFKLEDGNPVRVPFFYDEKLQDTWTVSNPMSFRLLYSERSSCKFITHFKNPSIGPLNVYRIWNLNEGKFTLDRTIGDIQE